MSRTAVDLEAPEEREAGHGFRLISHPQKPLPVDDELKRELPDFEAHAAHAECSSKMTARRRHRPLV